MKHLFLDIETFGNKPANEIVIPDLILPTRDDVKVGNVKDPDKMEVIIKEKLPILIEEAKAKHEELINKAKEDYDKEWRGNALKSLKLYVIAVSYAIDNGDIVNLIGDEKYVITALNSVLEDHKHECLGWNVISHYGKMFDIPILRHRAMKYGLHTLYNVLTGSGRYDQRIVDTHELFAGSDFKSHYSMDAICKFFGIEGKKGMTGAEVHDYYIRYLNGDSDAYNSIAIYCGDDVDALRRMYNVMRFKNIYYEIK